jgi:hypothetical protein
MAIPFFDQLLLAGPKSLLKLEALRSKQRCSCITMQMNPRITISTPYIRANKVQKQSDVRAVHSSVLPIRLSPSFLSILSVFLSPGFFLEK